MQNVEITLVGLAAGVGGSHHGCSEGPNFIKQHMTCAGLTLNWKSMISPQKPIADKYEQIAILNKQLAQETFSLAKENEFFVSVGGDHSSAIGTWSGVAEAKRAEGDIGLIWIDARMDAHTPQTTESGNIHGMPLAVLLGIGDKRLTQIFSDEPKLKPHNVVLIGTRSFEPAEAAHLRDLGVKVYFMEEINERGLEVVVQEAIKHVSRHTIGYGVSFDLVSLDPEYIQAVSSPVEGDGLDPDEMLSALELFHQNPPLAFEVVEYNPWFDQDRETFSYVRDVFLSFSTIKKTISQNLEKVLC
jgi:arginase